MPQLVFDALNQVRRLDDNRARDLRAYAAARDELERRHRPTRYLGGALILLAVVSGNDQAMDWLASVSAASWIAAGVGLYLVVRR
jgi:ubiquinone biosynthesis protein